MAAYLINCLPSPNTNKSPYHLLHNKQPNYKLLRTFGCLSFPCFKHLARNKFSPRSTPCIFLCYPSSSKGYQCCNPLTGKVTIYHYVIFNEQIFQYKTSTTSISPSDNNSINLNTSNTHSHSFPSLPANYLNTFDRILPTKAIHS